MCLKPQRHLADKNIYEKRYLGQFNAVDTEEGLQCKNVQTFIRKLQTAQDIIVFSNEVKTSAFHNK